MTSKNILPHFLDLEFRWNCLLWTILAECYLTFLSFFLFKKILFISRERGREGGREKERKRNINVWLSLMRPPPGTQTATQACTLTGNQTSDPLVHRLNPLHHTCQGQLFFLILHVLCFQHNIFSPFPSFPTKTQSTEFHYFYTILYVIKY